MSGPFAPGDVVVCVDADDCPYHSQLPDDCPEMFGKVFRVSNVEGPDHHSEVPCPGFIQVEGASGEWWCIGTFRHLPKADDAFTAQMRAIKPARKQVSA